MKSYEDFDRKTPVAGQTTKEVRDREILMLKSKLKRSQNVCKAIWEYKEYVEEIKCYLLTDELTAAEELFEELDYGVQKLLMTAPTKGGPFTTAERATMRSIWKIKAEDI